MAINMLRFSNRTGQVGTYKTGSPSYADLTAGAISGWVSVSDTVTADGWQDGDTTGTLLKKDNANWVVCISAWDESNSRLNIVQVESSLGTLVDNDVIEVVLCSTRQSLEDIAAGLMTVETGTTRTLSVSDHCKTIRFTSASSVVVSPPDTLPPGFQCMLIQEGAGLVSVDPQGSDVLNTGTTTLSLAGRWTSALLYKPSSGSLVLLA
jgi:hypothetical protein